MASRRSRSHFAGFCFGPDEPVTVALRRIADEELHRASRCAVDRGRSLTERVHEARKSCKRLRALLRLVRVSDAEGSATENAELRGAARELSTCRDLDVMIATCMELAGPTVSTARRSLWRLRRRLLRERSARGETPRTIERKLQAFAATVRAMQARVLSWRGLGAATLLHVEHGFVETYQESRRALRRVKADPLGDQFHDLRKRIKEHGFHLRLLQERWPCGGRARLRRVDRLSALLGYERDLAMLGDAILGAAENRPLTPSARALLKLIDQQRVPLRARVLATADRILAESPTDLLARLRGWRAAA